MASDNDRRERETLPPDSAELVLVETFEREAREDENAARLAQLARIVHLFEGEK